MSTNDVPGAKAANRDTLAMGCWAEHDDGSLIFVESTEANRVIYSIFDVSKDPIVEYRDAMPEATFKKQFSFPSDITNVTGAWTWHDKTPFPWDRVIRQGAQDRAMKFASADDQLSAAERVARSLSLRAQQFDARRRRRPEPQRTETRENRNERIMDMITDLRERLDDLEDQVTTADPDDER